MGKSSYLTRIASAAIVAAGYLGNVDSVEAQDVHLRQRADSSVQRTIKQDRIVSSDPCLSAAGDAIFLKNYCHDLDFGKDTKINLKDKYNLSALVSKSLTYSAYNAKDGVKMGISRLGTFKPYTERDVATRKFLQKLSRVTPLNDAASVSALGSAIRDGVLEGSELIGKVLEGRYAIMSTSSNNSLPQFVNITYNAEKAREKTSVDSLKNEIKRSFDLALISKKAKIRETQVADSVAKAVRDSVEKIGKGNKPVTDSVAKLDNKKSSNKDTTSRESGKNNYDHFTGKRIGLEIGYGTNNELVTGAFLEIPLVYRVNLEIFGNYFVSQGKSDTLNVRADTTMRDRQLIGPGTYKQRIDRTLTVSEDENKLETGLGLLLKADRVGINLRGGIGMSSEEEKVYGESTISFERNMLPLGQPETIKNSKPETKKKTVQQVFSAGATYDLNKNFSVGVSVNKFGKKSGGRINFKYRF